MLNSPVMYIDPSGHIPIPEEDQDVLDYLEELSEARENEGSFSEEISPRQKECSQTNLVACYEEDTGPYWKDGDLVELGAFNKLLIAIYNDYSNNLFYTGLQRYSADTPFWNGNGAWVDSNNNNILEDGEIDPDGSAIVCFEWGVCYEQIDVNYVAQGMWSAAKGQSLERAKEVSENWKHGDFFVGWINPDPDPTYNMGGINFWIEVGYNVYEALEAMEEGN